MKKDNNKFLDQQSYADNWREIVEEERRERVENRTRVLTSATIAAVTTLFFRLVLEPWILSLLP